MTLIDRARRWGEERNQQWRKKGIEQGRREGFERGRLEGIELGIPQGVERGRIAGERELVSRLVNRRIGVAAAVHFLLVLNRLSEGERITAIARLPPHNKFADIRELETVGSPEELEQLAESLADWVERTGAPELLDRFREWVVLVLASAVHCAGGTRKPGIPGEAEATTATIVEQSRKWGEKLDKQWFSEGIEKGRREGVEEGWLEVERKLVERLVTEKFGPGAAENLAPVLGSLSDPERMAAIADAVLDCETAEEFSARIADA